MEEIFRHAYLRNIWGDPESVSGPGSGLARTASFREEIPQLLTEVGAQSLLDAGCGDFNRMQALTLPVKQYVGIDIVPELVAQNDNRYRTGERRFIHADILATELPRADVILCRDCLVHFSFEDVWRALRNFRRSKSRYLLTTTFIKLEKNADIGTGDWRALNLQRPPFSLPPPAKLIDERCPHPGYDDKQLALWRLDAVSIRSPDPSAPSR